MTKSRPLTTRSPVAPVHHTPPTKTNDIAHACGSPVLRYRVGPGKPHNPYFYTNYLRHRRKKAVRAGESAWSPQRRQSATNLFNTTVLPFRKLCNSTIDTNRLAPKGAKPGGSLTRTDNPVGNFFVANSSDCGALLSVTSSANATTTYLTASHTTGKNSSPARYPPASATLCCHLALARQAKRQIKERPADAVNFGN